MSNGWIELLRPHPSVLLFSTCCVLLLILGLPWPWVGWACLLLLVAASIYSGIGLLRLLRRSRWLLLATLMLFIWMTPGMPVPGLPGATQDGLQQAIEQMARLIASIATVAMLLTALGKQQLVSACYGLLLPLQVFGVDVARWVIRLALTLKSLDDAGESADKKGAHIVILREPLHAVDYGVLALLLLLATTRKYLF